MGSRWILASPTRSPPFRLEPFDHEPPLQATRDTGDTSPARDRTTPDSLRLTDRTTMEPRDAPRLRDRDHSLEFHARNSNPRLVPHAAHEGPPFVPVRSAPSAKTLVHRGVRELVTNDLIQERRRSVEQKVRDSNLFRTRNIEAEGNAHPRTDHDSNPRFETGDTPRGRPNRKLTRPGRAIERRE
jgi:hypothetical protein